MRSSSRNIAAIIISVALAAGISYAQDLILETLSSDLSVIHYPEGLDSDALIVQDVYAEVYAEVTGRLDLKPGNKPQIILIPDTSLFSLTAGNRHIAAYASADKGMIVIDYSRVLKKPFTLRSTIMHETVHLAIGSSIRGPVPKWLNEGVAQFITDNPAELVLSRSGNTLNGAALSGRLLSLESISDRFPNDKEGMVLAYEQSLSITRYIESEYGKGTINDILALMAEGLDAPDALRLSTGDDMHAIESGWAKRLKDKASWLAYISNHFYELLFICGALLTISGFLRLMFRIRRYKDEDDGDPPFEYH